MVKILLDAGHGGSGKNGDPGAVGKYSYEKDNVLKVALRLKQLLEQAGHTVKLTRSTDVYLTLSQRSAISNKWRADYFFSLHNNAAVNRGASGFETFIFNGKVSSKSVAMQNTIHKAISNELKIKDRGTKRANFAVLRNTDAPAVLIEYAFISNSDDESVLINKVEQMAVSTAQGIINYIGGKPISSGQVASTNKPKPTKKEKNEMEFTSPALKEEFELTMNSKARRQIIVTKAIEGGASKSWQTKLDDGTITHLDLASLCVKYIIDTHK